VHRSRLDQILGQDLHPDLGRRQPHRRHRAVLAPAAKRLQLSPALSVLASVFGGQLGQRLGDARRPRPRIDQLLGQLITPAARSIEGVLGGVGSRMLHRRVGGQPPRPRGVDVCLRGGGLAQTPAHCGWSSATHSPRS
jgi:hypothetical protein